MMSRLRDGYTGMKISKTPIINSTNNLDEARDDVDHFDLDDEVVNGSITKQTNEGSQKSGSKVGSIKTNLFSWRKNKGSHIENKFESQDAVHRPVRIFDISGVPTKSEDLPEVSINGSETSGLAFPVPNEEGQEIAIQDDEHYYEDPANVHSMLTMPSFEQHKDSSIRKRENDKDSIVFVLTNTEDEVL
jgi:hypothetical protein